MDVNGVLAVRRWRVITFKNPSVLAMQYTQTFSEETEP